MKKLIIIFILMILFVKPAEAKSVDELLEEYKGEYAVWKREQEIKVIVNKLVAPYEDKNKANQKIIARAFYLNFDEYTAKIALEVAHNESNFRSEVVSPINKNGTYDKGCWQINDCHKLADNVRLNCKKATEWAVAKVKRDGGFNAWVAYVKYVKNKL